MDLAGKRIGVLHSVLGENDGVSIVIDQSLGALRDGLGVPLADMPLLCARAAEDYEATRDPVFWHKSEANRHILEHFTSPPPGGLDAFIREHAEQAEQAIARFVSEQKPDILIVHNGCHPSNFVYAAGAGLYFEEARRAGRAVPKHVLWWHDSHLERERFAAPNAVVAEWLKYIPGRHLDGVVFINSTQAALAEKYLRGLGMTEAAGFLKKRSIVIPNTCDIPWDWRAQQSAPPTDDYNSRFFVETGIDALLTSKGFRPQEAVMLLQHTRVVERKRIDQALDFAVRLAGRNVPENRCVVLLVSGRAGDEHDTLIPILERHLRRRLQEHPHAGNRVFLRFAADFIAPERGRSGERMLFRFRDIPAVIARRGGLGTYFSEVEGYGNNLLEMISMGLPAVVNRYPVYQADIEPLGFRLPSTAGGKITDRLLDDAWRLIEAPARRKEVVLHNLEVLDKNLNHGVLADGLRKILTAVL